MKSNAFKMKLKPGFEELEEDIIEKISILGKGGGYMISPAHIIQNDVSPERVLKFIELCMKHGKTI